MVHGAPGGLKLFMNKTGCFGRCFGSNFFKMIIFFAIFAPEDSKQILSRLYVAIFQFYAEICPKDAEDAEIGKLCGFAPPHPVRCPVI